MASRHMSELALYCSGGGGNDGCSKSKTVKSCDLSINHQVCSSNVNMTLKGVSSILVSNSKSYSVTDNQ